MHTTGGDIALGSEVMKRCHYCREPGHFMRECEKKTKDMAMVKEQSS